jgi:hypothetical protein
MEPVWVLLRCFRTIPDGPCLVLGAYHTAGSAIASAEQRESIPADAWKEPRRGHQVWHAAHRQFEYKLESFMVPAALPQPIDSIELESIH